jgi:SAM-dependent methyltransferase
MAFTERFDAIVGRLVMMYLSDPVDALRKLTRHLHPGGLIAVQEIDMESWRVVPASPLFSQCLHWINRTFQATRARIQMGLELHSTFLQAGLPAPRLRLDAIVSAGAASPLYSALTEVVRSLMPAMEKFDVATAEQVGISDLEQRLQSEVVSSGGVAISPSLIGAWTRMPA